MCVAIYNYDYGVSVDYAWVLISRFHYLLLSLVRLVLFLTSLVCELEFYVYKRQIVDFSFFLFLKTEMQLDEKLALAKGENPQS